MSAARGYLEKVSSDSGVVDLESFSFSDWVQLLHDVVGGSSAAEEALGRERGAHVVDRAMTLVLRASPECQRLAARAAVACLRALEGEGIDENQRRLLAFWSAIRSEETATSLVGIADACPAPLRRQIALRLSTLGAARFREFWSSIDLSAEPELAAAVLHAFRDSPRTVLRKLSTLEVPPSDIGELEDPLIDALAHSDVRERTEELLQGSAGWLLDLIDELEDAGQIPPRGAAYDVGWSPTLSRLSRELSRSHVLPITTTGYLSSSPLDENHMPDCLRHFLHELLRSLEKIANLEPDSLTADLQPISDYDSLVQKAGTWRVPLIDLATGTRTRLEEHDIVRVGEVRTFTVISSAALERDIRIHLARPQKPSALLHSSRDDPPEPQKSMVDVYKLVADMGWRVCPVASSALAEDLGDIFRETYAATSARAPGLRPLQISEPGVLADYVRDQRALGVLDWNHLSTISHDGLVAFAAKLTNSLPVGFLYPRGDFVFGTWLSGVVNDSLMLNPEKRAQLDALMLTAQNFPDDEARPTAGEALRNEST